MFLKALALVFMFLVRLRFPKNLSIIQDIHKRYGNTLVKFVNRFEKLDFKHRKAASDLPFFENCQELKATPKFLLSFKSKVPYASDSPRQSQTYQACKKQLLLEEIRIKKKKLKTLVTELLDVKEELLCSTSVLDINHFFNLSVSSIEKSILKCRHVQHKKLGNLMRGYKPETSLDSHDPEKVISSFYSHIL